MLISLSNKILFLSSCNIDSFQTVCILKACFSEFRILFLRPGAIGGDPGDHSAARSVLLTLLVFCLCAIFLFISVCLYFFILRACIFVFARLHYCILQPCISVFCILFLRFGAMVVSLVTTLQHPLSCWHSSSRRARRAEAQYEKWHRWSIAIILLMDSPLPLPLLCLPIYSMVMAN